MPNNYTFDILSQGNYLSWLRRYGPEAWTLLSTDTAALSIYKRKVQNKIFGPVRVGDDFHIRSNNKQNKHFQYIDVEQGINIQ